MQASELLLSALEDLGKEDFSKFKWYLSMSITDGCKGIPKSRLEGASRTDTVDEIMKSYKEELAVKVTVEILRRMYFNVAAEELRSSYAGAVDALSKKGGNTATSSSSSSTVAPPAAPTAPAMITAQQGSVIVAPVVGGTSGSWNITISK